MSYTTILNGADLDATIAMANWDANRTLILSHPLSYISDITASAAELNKMDGVTSSTAELNILTGVTATATEINLLDNCTATTAELNYLDITTLGTAEASKAVTADASANIDLGAGTVSLDKDKLIIDAVAMTCTSTELNVLDGIPATLTATEVGYSDGVTSGIQGQLDGKVASADNVGKRAFGTYAGTGSTVNVEFGFRPDLVEIFNSTNYVSFWISEKFDSTTAGFHGNAGQAGAIYTVTFDTEGFNTTGANAHVNGTTYYYRAYST